MEFKPSVTAIFLLFLLLAVPCLSRGGLDALNMDSGIYDIDYRGPETHSHRHRASPHPNGHKKGVMTHRKSKGFRAGDAGASGMKIHG